MKKVYSALASLALLFSLPSLAAPLAQKANNVNGKESSDKKQKDTVRVQKVAPRDTGSPICRGGGD